MRTSAILFLCWLYCATLSVSSGAGESFWKAAAGKKSNCRDKLPESVCQKDAKYCRESDKLKELCPRTCGECRAISPLPCQVLPYGCCWDGFTAASGPKKAGCPACKDLVPKCSKYASREHCSQSNIIKRACPLSCGLCSECRDRFGPGFCSKYKKIGLCEIMKGRSKVELCQKTCNYC